MACRSLVTDPISIEMRLDLLIGRDTSGLKTPSDIDGAIDRLTWWRRVLERCESPIELAFIAEMVRDTDWMRLKNGDAQAPFMANRWTGNLLYQQYETERFRLDFAMISNDFRVDIELDGDEFHSSPSATIADERRDATLSASGWVIVRIPGSDIWRDPRSACRRIWTMRGAV